MGRRFFMMPTVEEQQFVSIRGCLYTAAQFTSRNLVAGDYLEFGVWEGDSFVKSYHAISSLRRQHFEGNSKRSAPKDSGASSPEYQLWRDTKPRFFAFDSFAGLPKSAERQIEEDWVEGAYGCSEVQFRKNIVSEGVLLSDVILVPGFYDKSLNEDVKKKYQLRRAAIVHIDCDLYESTILALTFVTDLLGQGSVLIFDDWYYNQGRTDLGEPGACREWLERNPSLELIPYWQDVHAASFIVNLK
jgi:O-methyltransferase